MDPWSSAAAHLAGKDDVLVLAAPILKEIQDWRRFLRGKEARDVRAPLRRHGRTGRPLGSPQFLERPENRPGRVFRRHKPGPKPKGDQVRRALGSRKATPT